ncbi:ATP-binding protein, partial [Burkholderiaceae bacterium DAT-1]|nr:ATP-binding protein [Burkholderiaceae bacterium DAT-1]
SYQDVRELLANFRSKLGPGELRGAIHDTISRFTRQTGIEVDLSYNDHAGQPLPPEQQLQIVFIVQEALSNIRKHAHASEVRVRIDNDRDFKLEILDNGDGFDLQEVQQRGEVHVGLNIMRERAASLHAGLTIDSSPGQGTRIALSLQRDERQIA